MSVSRKILRKMKKVMGVVGASAVLVPCSSQVSCAKVKVRFDSSTGTLHFSSGLPGGTIDDSWQELYNLDFIRRVVIDNGIKGIGNRAFSDCRSLEEITIPSSVTTIGSFAFWNCASLKEITIPNSVSSIGDLTFSNCGSLKEITIPNSVSSIGVSVFSGCRSLKEITIPNSVSSIGKFTFCDCESLTKITIPRSVTSIGDYAFCRCASLEEVTIPNSVSSIGEWAFYNCKTLESIVFENCGRGKDIVALNAFNVCFGKLIENKVLEFRKDLYGDLKSNEYGTLSSLLKKFLHGGKVAIGANAFDNCKRLVLIDTDGLVLICAIDAFYGTIFQNLGGKIICGKYYKPYHHDMMAKMFLLDSINNSFNKNGKEENPVNCLRRYPPFSYSCC